MKGVREVGWAVKPSVLGFEGDWEGSIASARNVATAAGMDYLVVDAEFEQQYPPPTVVQDLLSTFDQVRLMLTIQALSNAGLRLLTALGKRKVLNDDNLIINLVRGNDAYLSPAEKEQNSITALRRTLGVLDKYHAKVWVGGEGPLITRWAMPNHNADRFTFFALMNTGLHERLTAMKRPGALYTLALHAEGDGYHALADKMGTGYFLRRPWVVDDLKVRGIDPQEATSLDMAPYAQELGIAGAGDVLREQVDRLPPMDKVVFYVPETDTSVLETQLTDLGNALRGRE
ncbi:MAG: hypothetical protein QGG50_07255 [Methanopyri archaeon]|jgi:hypothetical protein|nr:hypothetical protein [Methanopyri archaeon]